MLDLHCGSNALIFSGQPHLSQLSADHHGLTTALICHDGQGVRQQRVESVELRFHVGWCVYDFLFALTVHV